MKNFLRIAIIAMSVLLLFAGCVDDDSNNSVTAETEIADRTDGTDEKADEKVDDVDVVTQETDVVETQAEDAVVDADVTD